LVASLADWLNRTDLTAQIPDFITLAEAEMKRRLRRTSTKTTISITGETVAIPATVAETRSLWLSSGSPYQDVPLRLCTPEMLAERKARSGAVVGRPTDFAVMGSNYIFEPAPDQTYTGIIFYYAALIPLTALNLTNVVMTEAPDAYLYGSLLQAEPFLEHDERVPLWRDKFDRAIDQLNLVRENEEYTASLRSSRLPTVFG
jgi:hypothetical protein